MWSRDTPWRQGSIIESAKIPGADSTSYSHMITASHSCDLACDISIEPSVLLLGCNQIDTLDGNLTHAKNPRCLHLEVESDSGPLYFKLDYQHEMKLGKDVIEEASASPDEQYQLSPSSISIYQDWLACRYRRQAFPENLDASFIEIKKQLAKVGKRHAQGIYGFWIDYDPREEESPNHPGPYQVWFYIIFDANKGGEGAAAELREAILTSCSNDKIGEMIALQSCEVISTAEFTHATSKNLISFRLDYISHKAGLHDDVAR